MAVTKRERAVLSRDDVTQILQELGPDNPDAAERLVPILYRELRAVAANYMRAERQNHTLEPTALVHEAFIRLVDQKRVNWQNRAHFLAIAARTMRRILIDHARRQKADKRGGGSRVTLHEDLAAGGGSGVDILALEQALERLLRVDERVHQVVELRFFAGLDVRETAAVLGISEPTVKRDWRFARAWLTRELRSDDTGAGE
jgi:RNA polymerase sigma factor (TIGR02999 family)